LRNGVLGTPLASAGPDQESQERKDPAMKASEGRIGRVFVIRLEDGDKIPECIESFAEQRGISLAHVILIGGIAKGQVVVGPEDTDERPPVPMLWPVNDAHEMLAAGIIAPDQDGKPILHVHASLGRSDRAVTGCLRTGVFTWLVGEVILYEILEAQATRLKDKESGLSLLQAGPVGQE